MTTTERRTMTLEAFLTEYAICRTWHAGVGCPGGYELVLNTDGEGEDYCDSETLIGQHAIQDAITEAVEGYVSQDKDGEWRWESGSLEDVDLRDERNNTVYNLKVWGETVSLA